MLIVVSNDPHKKSLNIYCHEYRLLDHTLFIVCGYIDGHNPNELNDFVIVLGAGDVVVTKSYPANTPIPDSINRSESV